MKFFCSNFLFYCDIVQETFLVGFHNEPIHRMSSSIESSESLPYAWFCRQIIKNPKNDIVFTCWSEPSWLNASRDVFTFCTLPGCGAFFFVFVVDSCDDVAWGFELPRFFTFGFGVADGTNLWRVVDDDMLLVLLVLVCVLLKTTLDAVIEAADGSVDWECVDATIIWGSQLIREFLFFGNFF